MSGSLSHRRLAWLAMREHCETRAKRRGLFDWLTILFAGRYDAIYDDDFDMARANGAGCNRDLLREGRNDKLMDYAIAVDRCADRLDAGEIRALRGTGRLPEWFVAAVEDGYREDRATRRVPR